MVPQPASPNVRKSASVGGFTAQEPETSILSAPGEFSTSFSSTSTTGKSALNADCMPEQKIFPGIVHERAHRSNMPFEGINTDDGEDLLLE